MTTRRTWNRNLSRPYKALGMLCLALTIGACSERASNGINVIVIVADDLGWSDVGFTGATDPRTPNLDALANDSFVFENFYASAACTPTRYSLMTGNYADRSRDRLIAALAAKNKTHGLREDEHTIAESLDNAGYATAVIGKWHLGHGELPAHPPGSGAMDSEFHPHHHGFDLFHGPLTGAIDYLSHWNYRGRFFDWWEGLVPYTDGLSGVYATTAIRNRALEFIDKQEDEPFLLYLPFTAPHTSNSPYDSISKLQLPPERERELDALFDHVSAGDVKRRRYLAMVYLLDEAVGDIVARLEARELRSRTLIWFLSDNGGNPDWGASNAPFRDGKASSYEGGVHVPAFLHVPGRPGERVELLAAHVDILPTTLHLLGLPVPNGLDGLDLGKTLLEGKTSSRVLYRSNEYLGDFLREGPLKIIRNRRDQDFELYDLSVDPSETTDLSLRSPAEVKRLIELWDSWVQPRIRAPKNEQ